MAAHGCTHAVMEVSGRALADGRVAGIAFDAACVTNVRRDHLNYPRHVVGQSAGHTEAFPAPCAGRFRGGQCRRLHRGRLLAVHPCPGAHRGHASAAEITAALVERFVSEQTFLLHAGSDTVPVRTRMIGVHHVYNCLMAAAVGLAFGIDLPTVVRGLEAVECVPGRLERVECGQEFGVFVDFARTPDALAAALAALREVTAGRLICVFGAGADCDPDARPLMARQAHDHADLVIVTGDDRQGEDPWAMIRDFVSGLESPGETRIVPAPRGDRLCPGRSPARRLRADCRQGIWNRVCYGRAGRGSGQRRNRPPMAV